MVTTYRVTGLKEGVMGFKKHMAFYAVDDKGKFYIDARFLDRASMLNGLFDGAVQTFDKSVDGTDAIISLDWLIENCPGEIALFASLHKERLMELYQRCHSDELKNL